MITAFVFLCGVGVGVLVTAMYFAGKTSPADQATINALTAKLKTANDRLEATVKANQPR